MIFHIVDAKYIDGYQIWIKFNDGAEGTVDLKEELYGEMFEPLRNFDNFKSFHIDRELETLVWENGADFAPEFLHEQLMVES